MTQLLIQTKECIEQLNNFYLLMQALGTNFGKPTQEDAMEFAYTESGELLDAYMRVYKSKYQRNNPRDIDESEIWMELTQCMCMLMLTLSNDINIEQKYLLHDYYVAYKDVLVSKEPIDIFLIRTICMDVNYLFSRTFNNNGLIHVDEIFNDNSIQHDKLFVTNKLISILLEYDKLEFFNKVLDKWLQNHYVKHLLIGFNLNVNIYNVYDLYQKGYISSLC